MEINYRLTEEDYLKFNMFHINNSDSANKSLKTQRFATPFVYIIFAYIFANIADIPFLYALIPFLIVGILWVIFYPKYFQTRILSQTKKMIREGKNEGLLGEHTMTLSEDGIVDSNPKGETKVNWSGIIKLTEDDSNLYLYNSSVSAYIIPKREVNDLEGLRNFMKTKLTHLEIN
ncbi:YcxB family protein [Neobacillus niacini]|uniref:YcxB family protein n=1 Tax=Neobacillus niacini TaxID=86668 RepID=UPI00203EFB68|nr:YcxB family protein [Neobacillus niacini]MCM3693607.1 YcxB family protein [Neobacillus niacini]